MHRALCLLSSCLLVCPAVQVANAVTVYVRRPGNPKKWRAAITCMGKQSDLALLTVPEDAFWGNDLRPLVFLKEVPELQVLQLLLLLCVDVEPLQTLLPVGMSSACSA